MKIKIVILIIIVTILFTCLGVTYFAYTKSENNLYNKTIFKYIQYDLWDEKNCYDAGHVLLVPMFYAFQSENKDRIEQFHNLFERYAKYLKESHYSYKYLDLNHMQFNFLASNYINLCAKYQCTDRIKNELLYYLYDESFFSLHD